MHVPKQYIDLVGFKRLLLSCWPADVIQTYDYFLPVRDQGL